MMTKRPVILSKSRLKRGLQCAKSLYYTVYRKELEAPPTPAKQLQFDEGNEVGELARKKFEPGFLIDLKPWDFEGYINATKRAIESGETIIFEAAVVTGNLFARTDVLKKGRTGWDIIEVKKSTDVKQDHLDDVTIQYLISQKAGLKIDQIYVMHINRECEFPNLEDLFIQVNVTEQVHALAEEMKNKLNTLWKVNKDAHEPEIDIGPHCDSPYECVFKDHCWQKITELSVFNVYKLGSKKWDYYAKNKINISDLDPSEFTGVAKRMIECTQNNETFIDEKEIAKQLKSFKFPLYFLDFETVMFAIPRYNKTRPYQQIPVQYSLHVWPEKGSSHTTHSEFLHVEDSDPGIPLLESLQKVIGAEGAIVSYNKRFESDCLEKLAERFPQYKNFVKNVVSRLVDPLPIFQNFVYHPEFRGSFSIKNVAPALLGSDASYEGMEVGDGEMAQVVLRNLVTGKLKEDPKEMIDALLKYCRKDTWLMVELVRWLLAYTQNKSASLGRVEIS